MERMPMSPQEALPAIRAALDDGRPCLLTVTGSSMLPFLRHKKDAVVLIPPMPPYRRGDILFYLRGSSQCVLHRVHRVQPDGTLLVCGDAQSNLENVQPAQIVASVSHIRRSGKLLPCSALSLRFAVALWQLLRPLHTPLLRLALRLRHIGKS